MSSLSRKLEKLSRMRDHAQRGKELERLVRDVFEVNGAVAAVNSRAAKPRQTDIYAVWDSLSIIVEVKWRKTKAGSNDIRELRDRLNKTPQDIIGIMFSISGYSKNAVKDVEENRSREILLFTGFETRMICNGSASLQDLIEGKRDELRQEGKVWFFKGTRKIRKTLPFITKEFAIQFKNAECESIPSSSDNSSVMFTIDLPDTRWPGHGGHHAIIDLSLKDVSTLDEMKRILELTNDIFHLTEKGAFSIDQLYYSWHGIGASAFLSEAAGWRARYNKAKLDKVHHSEGLAYFDALEDGWFLLTANQRVPIGEKRRPLLYHTRILIELPGIPIRNKKFELYCRELDHPEARFYEGDYHKIVRARLKKPVRLVHHGLITKKREQKDSKRDVLGVVAENPFFRATELPEEIRSKEDDVFRELVNVQHMFCYLTDWHDTGHEVDYYELMSMECIQAGEQTIIKAFATWHSILNRPEPDVRTEEEVRARFAELMRDVKQTKKQKDERLQYERNT